MLSFSLVNGSKPFPVAVSAVKRVVVGPRERPVVAAVGGAANGFNRGPVNSFENRTRRQRTGGRFLARRYKV